MSTTWQRPAWCGRSCFHVLLLMGALTMWSTGASAQFQELEEIEDVRLPAPPTGACCRGDGTCVITTQSNCSGPCDNYQGDGTTCNGAFCLVPLPGACCLSNGTCIVTQSCLCTAQGGTPQGIGSSCGQGTCPATGACCRDDGTCRVTTQADCDGPCETYRGNGTTCAGPLLCLVALPSACCLANGTCIETTACQCTAQGGTAQSFGSSCTDPGICPVAPFCTDASTKGCWSDILNFGVNSVNMVAMKTGKVMITHQSFSEGKCDDPPGNVTGRCYQLFDPATDMVGARLNVTTEHNLYCSGFDQLGDGRILWIGSVDDPDHLLGTSIYDPDSGLWSEEQDGFSPRFYPTVKTLPNGKMLVIGGATFNSCSSANVVPDVDVFDADQPVGRQWETLTNATFLAPPNDFELGLYARMEGLSDGSFIYTGSSFVDRCNVPASGRFTRILDPVLEIWTQPFAQQDAIPGGPGLLFQKDVMMKANGGLSPATAIDKAYVLDMTAPNPAWVEVASMNKARRESYLIALADGKIAVTGGENTSGKVTEAEIYDPAGGFGMGNPWTLGAAADPNHLRGEHSSAVLLVDGRILVAGNDLTGQIYYPPHLFEANDSLAKRPKITSVKGAGTNLIRYGEAFSIKATYPAGQASGSLRLIRFGMSTHSLDQGQQSMALDFTPACCNPNAEPGVGGNPACIEGATCCDDGLWACNAGNGSPSCSTVCPTLKAAAPLQPAEAPPGYYYLFLMSSRGVPSVAAIVQLELCP